MLLNAHRRSRRRRWWGEVPTEVLPESVVVGEGDAGIDVRTALSSLPMEQRAVVVLRHLADLTEVAVAEVLGIPVGTVKSRNARGLARLAEMLDGAEGGVRS